MESSDCISFPIIGEPAPDFEAETTHGPIKLSDLKGKWVVMFSHPADFTPVCTTEFMAFAAIYDELKALNVQLIGLSVDSISAHLAWVHAIKEKMGVADPVPDHRRPEHEGCKQVRDDPQGTEFDRSGPVRLLHR